MTRPTRHRKATEAIARRRTVRVSKIATWPGCSFDLKLEWDKDPFTHIRHLWVHLERRAAGKFGRLEVMHALVPGKNADSKDRWMFGARFHRNLYVRASEVFKQAGVPESLAQEYLQRMSRELPIPSDKDVFLHSIDSPMMNKVLGNKKKELSYFKTGRPELTKEDLRLINDRMKDKMRDLMDGPGGFDEKAKFLQELIW